MPEFVVTISEEGLKAIEAADGGGCYDFQGWIQNAATQKERRSMDILVEQNSNLNFKKISKAQKREIIRGLNFETAKERTDRLEQELKAISK